MLKKKNNIKRSYESDDVHAHLVNMKGKKPKNNTTAPNAGNNNYFSPLQTIDDDDIENDKITSEVKTHIPPITILKCKIEEIHEICKLAKICDYSIRKISIGNKFFCNSKHDFETMCNQLKEKYEFFTYAAKDEKPYKALLFGLDSQDPAIIKKKLIEKGLQCIDVKIVHKKSQYGNFVIYVVYFKRKTITIKELRQNFSVMDYIKVKWDFQMTKKTRITQCHNCQMYGHGSSRCRVKTFCAKCAGNHNTTDCKESVVKCANCNGSHKSTDENCPSKTQYLNMKQRQNFTNKHQRSNRSNFANDNNNFPNTLQQNPILPQPTGAWQYQRNIGIHNNFNANNASISQNSGELFSIQELQSLTFELITNLRKCRNKMDQFEVITSLACKFLS